jgi:hypothetical protein
MTADQPPAQDEPAASGEHGPLPFDMTVAHQARMYDYVLGGKDNYAADRAAVEAWLKVNPYAAFTARANRAFLGRAVRYLAADAGIRQFLDIGTGIPTASNTHEVAQAIAPESRVVYVDYDRCKSCCAHAGIASPPFAWSPCTGRIRPALTPRPHSLWCQTAGIHFLGLLTAGARPVPMGFAVHRGPVAVPNLRVCAAASDRLPEPDRAEGQHGI